MSDEVRRGGVAGAVCGIAPGPFGAVVDVAIPLLVSPLLLFPRGVLPLVGLAAILTLWVARWVVWRTPFRTNPLGLPMLLFLVMAAQALYPSVDLSLSMPKLYGIVLGVAVYYGVATGVRSRRVWWIAVGALMVAAVAVAAIGLVSTAWISGKLPGTAALYGKIPHLISSVPSSFGTIAGIHPNEVGGTLAFLLPLPFGLLLWSLRPPRSSALSPQPSVLPPSPALRVSLLALTLLVTGAVLVLTVSRSALMGTAAAAVLLVALRWRRVGLLLGAAGVLAVTAMGVIGPMRVYDWIVQADQASRAGGSTLVSRQEVWNRALYMIQDFPFTGIGLNTFPIVLDNLYPSFLAGPDARIPHAHDIYLQTAVDLGLAGLMAFLGLWAIVAREWLRAFRRAGDPLLCGAVAGLGAGCLAYLVFGVTDAITLGAKPLVLLWAMVGLIVAANRLLRDGERGRGGEGESVRLELSPQPSVRGPRSSVLGWSSLAKEAGRTLWGLYWVLALLFVAMAYLVVIITATGWVP